MLALNPDSRFQLEEDILLQAIPELDHYYAFNTKDGDNFQLNHTAHWVLTAITRGVNYSGLMEGFLKEYGLDKKTAEEDVRETLQYALNNQIIKEVKP